MKIVLSLSEIGQIVVDHLVEISKIPDDGKEVTVTWAVDRYNIENSTLTIGE